ncbi:MAG: HAD family hydrolase [Caldilineaceae bacterium]
MTIKGIFFDFGFVIGFPRSGLDRRYFYLDWTGIDAVLNDQTLIPKIRTGIGKPELEAFFQQEIYAPFVQHEQSDSIDPQSNQLLLDKLHLVFACPIQQALVDQVLAHLDTMKYFTMDVTAVNVLAALKQKGFRLALVSNMLLPGKLLRTKLQAANLFTYFDQIVVSSDVGFIKPHPEIFRRALTQCQLHAAEVLFVGDTYQQDIVGAKRVQLKTAWLNHRHEPRVLAAANPPDYEIASLAELTNLPIFAS